VGRGVGSHGFGCPDDLRVLYDVRYMQPSLTRVAQVLLVASSLAGTLLPASGAPSKPVSIAAVASDDLESLPYMCECEFYRGPISGETTVFATRDERNVALAEIDGRLANLRRDGEEALSICNPRREYHERWTEGSTSVLLVVHPTGRGEEACWYTGTMTVTVGRRRGSTAIRGSCGC
jgi:hypothetical protein